MVNLTYPSGAQISLGDCVWFDEGMAIGHVREITDEFDGEGILIIVDLFAAGAPCSISVGLPYECFDDEGVDLLTEEEKTYVNRAVQWLVSTMEIDPTCSAVFRTWKGGDLFLYVVAVYDENRNPVSAYELTAYEDGFISHHFPIANLPVIAFAVGGGGPEVNGEH